MLASAAAVWPPAARILADPDPGSLAVTADELALLGSSRIVTLLLTHRIDVEWPAELVRDVDARGSVRRVDTPARDRAPRVLPRPAVPLRLAARDRRRHPHRGRGRRAGPVPARPAPAARPVGPRRPEPPPARARAPQPRPHARPRRCGPRCPARSTSTASPPRSTPSAGSTTCAMRLAERGERAPVPQPPTLDGTLRDYQLDGLRWMAQLVDLGLGGVLADDMGLGKTVMLIALHLHRVELGLDAPTLVVCPASVLGNWEREIERFAPAADVRRYHGPGRSLDGATRRVRGHHLRDDAARRRADRRPRARLGPGGRRRGAERQERPGRRRASAADDPGRGEARAHRHAGREQPRRAVGDRRLDDARPARLLRALPSTLVAADRGTTRHQTRRTTSPC